jgi:hypothetical protein
MRIPNADHAVIDPVKITHYLLDVVHPRGGSKARLLESLGYSAGDWRQLHADLHRMHLIEGYVATRQTTWGIRYEIVAPITGPPSDTVLFRSVW